MVVLSLGLSGLGILIASFMRSQQGFQMLVNVLVFPLFFLAGVFFPVDSVPVWMEVCPRSSRDVWRRRDPANFLGSDLAVSGLGVTVFGRTLTVEEEVALVGALGVVLVAGAVWAFGRQEQ